MEKSELIKKLRTDLRNLDQLLHQWKGSDLEVKTLKSLALKMLEENFQLIFISENKPADLDPLPMFGVKPPKEMPAAAAKTPTQSAHTPIPPTTETQLGGAVEKKGNNSENSQPHAHLTEAAKEQAIAENLISQKTENTDSKDANAQKNESDIQVHAASESPQPADDAKENEPVQTTHEAPQAHIKDQERPLARIIDAVAPPRLEDKLRNARIEDLKKAIPLHEKFLYINELYQGEHALYSAFIELVNQCKSKTDAHQQFELETKGRGWDAESEIVVKLYSTIQRKFAE